MRYIQTMKQQQEVEKMMNTKTKAIGISFSSKAQEMATMALFTAIVLIMAFTPIGLIDLPLIKATILHVPVIIGAILLGPKKGAFLGFVFGLTSIIKNTMTPSILSFAFTPFMQVPGTESGSIWALFICFVPRILVGIVPYYVYRLIYRVFPNMKSFGKTIAFAICGAVGAMTNTILVMGSIYVFFKDAFAGIKGIAVNEVLNVITGIVLVNGMPEALVAAVITPFICLAVLKAGIKK